MNQITKHILGFTAIIAFVCPVFSQTLPDFINTALANNYQIRILKNEVSMAENMNTWGNAGLVPTINLEGGIGTTFNNTQQNFADGSSKNGTMANSSNINVSLLANWTAFDGLAVYAKKKKFGYLEEIGQLNTKFYIDQTVADVTSAYYQLVYANLLLEKYTESMKISKYRLTLEEQKQLHGAGNKLDLGQALVAYKTDSIRFLEQESNIKNLHLELNSSLNVDLETPINISVDDQSFDAIHILEKDTLINQTARNNQMLQISMLNELISESDVRIAKANYYPKINLYGGVQFNQSTAEVGFIELNRNFGPTLGLNVSFNLYNAGQTKTAVKNATIAAENTTLNKEDLQNNINAETLTMYYQYTSLLKRINLANSNIVTMEDVYKIAENQLNEGDINGYDFRSIQLTLLNTQIVKIQQQFTAKLIEINLNRISGNILSEYM